MKTRNDFLAAITPDGRLYQLMSAKDGEVWNRNSGEGDANFYRTYESREDGKVVLHPSLPSGEDKSAVETAFVEWAESQGYEVWGLGK